MPNRVDVSGQGYYATATFTPAAAAYGAGDVISVAQTLTWLDSGGVAFPGGELVIVSSQLLISETALQASEASYSLKLFNVTPPSARADNAVWDIPAGDRASYLGALALGTPVDIGSSLVIEVDNIQKMINVLPTGKTFAELVTAAGFTATATARKVLLHARAL